MREIVVWLLGMMLAGLAVAETAAMGRMADGWHGMGNTSMVRHRYVMRHGIGVEYASLTNPLEPSQDNLEQGKLIYQRTCTACHGPTGRGDGPAAANLDPRPTNVAAAARMPMATDGYLFWAIAEGGIPVGTGMPAFKDVFSEQEIWQLVLYLRSLR